jgi:membrane-associated phospholipid phosphatase
MTAVSNLGYTPVYSLLLLVLGFGIKLRPAMGVLLALVLNGIVTAGLKDSIAFPRPEHVQQLRDASPDSAEVFDADGFWGLPSPQATEAVRATPGISFGFPSGHVSAAMAFCLAVAIFFRWRAFVVIAAVWPLVMSLSRMYLGRHFVADVIAGLAVGAMTTLAAVAILRWVDGVDAPSDARRRVSIFGAALLALAVAGGLVPALDAENVGRLVGVGILYAALTLSGFPVEAVGIRPRVGRFLTAALIYVTLQQASGWLLDTLTWEDYPIPEMVRAALVLGGSFLGAVAVASRWQWYLPNAAPHR